MNRHAWLTILPALVLLGGGCTTYESGTRGSYQLKRSFNAWETVVNTPIDKTHRAVELGIRDLSLTLITNRADRLTGRVDGTFADGMDYEVRFEALSDAATKLSVRAGMFGNRERTTLLFRAIERHL